MKKIILLLTVFIILCVLFSSCKNTEDTNSSKTSQSAQQVETTRPEILDEDYFVRVHMYDDGTICYDPISKNIWMLTAHTRVPLINNDGSYITYDQYMEWYESNNN